MTEPDTRIALPPRRRPPPVEAAPPPVQIDLGVDAGAVAAALVVLAFGVSGAGAGFANGDAAVYAAQAAAGDLASRVVHVGYIAVAAVLGRIVGGSLPTALDVLTALACAATALGAGRLAGRLGRPPWVAAAVTGALLLPVASSAEADPLWIALLVWSAAVRTPWLAAVLAGLAVPVSPLALLGLPWVQTLRWTPTRDEAPRDVRRTVNRTPGLWLLPVVAVLVLTIASAGSWWTGDRGILSAPSPRPWRMIQAWATEGVPWWSLPLVCVGWVVGGGAGVLASWPFLLAPPDVDTWPLLTVSFALLAAEGVRWLGPVSRPVLLATLLLASADFGRGALRHTRHLAEVRADETAIAVVLAARGPNDGLVAPWSWGVRASVRATGDPYAPWWSLPDAALDDPTAWCGRHVHRVWTLPPEASYPLPDCAEGSTLGGGN